jgi:hypothetical protein
MTTLRFPLIWRAPARGLALTALGFLAAAPAFAIGCDELRSSIDARIRTTGVNNYSLSVMAASATAPGSVVGSCELGSKKIVYAKAAAEVAGSAPAPRPAAPNGPKPTATAPAVITECDDGATVTHGECKK